MCEAIYDISKDEYFEGKVFYIWTTRCIFRSTKGILNFGSTGLSIMEEMSHRGADNEAVHNEALQLVRNLLYGF